MESSQLHRVTMFSNSQGCKSVMSEKYTLKKVNSKISQR